MKYVPPLGEAPNTPYTDGNPAAGIEGSIVPAASIEHDQREIVAVIEGAGLTPDSADLTQLTQAIAKLITDAITAIPPVPNATTTARGIVELATNTEASAGTDTVRAVTPAGLAAAIAALAIDLNDFVKKAGDTMTGNLTISNDAPRTALEETDAPAGHAKVRIALQAGEFRINTYDANDVFVSQDFKIIRDDTGATSHQWNIGNIETMRLDVAELRLTENLTIDKDSGAIDLIDAGSPDTHKRTRIVRQNDNDFKFQTRDVDGNWISSDYLMDIGPSGAQYHLWRINNADRMRLDANGVEIISTFPLVVLTETNGDPNFNRARIVQQSNILRFESLNSAGTALSHDYRITKGAVGATTHQWRIGNVEKMRLDGNSLDVCGQPVLTNAGRNFSNNGYQRLSNGFIIQWGTLPGVLAAPTIGTFPITFPNAARTITAVVKDGLNRNKPVDAFINSPSQFQFQINTGTGMKVGWIAIGH